MIDLKQITCNLNKNIEQLKQYITLEYNNYNYFKDLNKRELNILQFSDIYSQVIIFTILFVFMNNDKNDIIDSSVILEHIKNNYVLLNDIFSINNMSDFLISFIDRLIIDFNSYIIFNKNQYSITQIYDMYLKSYYYDTKVKYGIYYTPQQIINYIVKVVNEILVTQFQRDYDKIIIIDSAAGTGLFTIEFLNNIHDDIKDDLIFYNIEIMIVSYIISYLNITQLLNRKQINNKVYFYCFNVLEENNFNAILNDTVINQNNLLVFIGNPPYNVVSSNNNQWINYLLKNDIDGALSYYKVNNIPIAQKNSKMLQDDYVKFIRIAQYSIEKNSRGIMAFITNNNFLDGVSFRGMRYSLLNTFNKIYILNLHGNARKKEKVFDGSKDENVFDIKQGLSINIMIKNKSNNHDVYYKDLIGQKQFKFNYLTNHKLEDYQKIEIMKPYYLFTALQFKKDYYLKWKSINQIMPNYSTGIITTRDNIIIHFNRQNVAQVIRNFKNKNQEQLRVMYNIGSDSRDWSIKKAKKNIMNDYDENKIVPVLYKPFDIRYTYYSSTSKGFYGRARYNIMKHMLNHDNIGLIIGRSGISDGYNHIWNLCFITNIIYTNCAFYRGGAFLYPLYLYNDFLDKQTKEYNFNSDILKSFNYEVNPQQLFYYIYAVLYSNLYRENYNEYLSVDFPRIPFTKKYQIFKELVKLGKQLANIHLLNYNFSRDQYIVKYKEVNCNNKSIDFVRYSEQDGTIKINKDNYFQGITSDLWEYSIGGYKTLYKYLKDRKGLILQNSQYFCLIATAINETIKIQTTIDYYFQTIIDEYEK